ncbi:hypothetical protein BG22_04560 [Bifidobacterium sp. UTBIF-78]|nr:hypothetical protein BG22_04560 [Bifidobacterium sp. UTBIF-78]
MWFQLMQLSTIETDRTVSIWIVANHRRPRQFTSGGGSLSPSQLRRQPVVRGAAQKGFPLEPFRTGVQSR